MRDKFRGCILGLAVGDALGYPLEFVSTRGELEELGADLGLAEGARFSDDTQMSICVAKALIEAGRDIETYMAALSANFVAWYKSQDDPRFNRAPGTTCLAGCARLASGVSWRESGIDGGAGCGTAMRSAPIGLYHDDLSKIVRWAIDSGHCTHASTEADCASVATALIAWAARNDVPVGLWGEELLGPLKGISDSFEDQIRLATELAASKESQWDVLCAGRLGEGWTGASAVASALFCCMRNPGSYADAVRMAALTVGDSDSIACITGAWMGAKLGEGAIPAEWRERVEAAGKLAALADRLLASKS